MVGFIIELLFELVFSVPAVRVFAITIIPSLLLLRYVRRHDRLEAEPPKLVWSLFGLGVAATVIAWLLEAGGLYILASCVPQNSMWFSILHWFIVVGVGEELSKYLVMRYQTWKNPEFNCLYDGLVYAVAVAAGFALLENILYLLRYGAGVVLIRAIVSIPGHICFGVFMGAWYSAAKKYQHLGDQNKSLLCRVLAVAIPALAHGSFDLLATSTGNGVGLITFVIYIVAMFGVAFFMMKKLSNNDEFYEKMNGNSNASAVMYKEKNGSNDHKDTL